MIKLNLFKALDKDTPPEVEHSDLRYFNDVLEELYDYLSKVILQVFIGLSKNIGVPNPDNLKPPELLAKAGFLGWMKNILKKPSKIFGKKRKVEPFEIKDVKVYEKGIRLTDKEWDELDKALKDYMKPYLSDTAEQMATNTVFLGMAAAEAEARGEQVDSYGKKSFEQVEDEAFGGEMPDTMKEANKIANSDVQKAIAESYDRAAMYVSNIPDDVREAIRQQVVIAHKEGKSPQELASDLYWMKDTEPALKKYTAQELLRDWQRLATTELNMIYSNGKLAESEHQARESMDSPLDVMKGVYYIFTRGSCEWCQSHQGILVRHVPQELVTNERNDSLKSMGIDDPYTDIGVWIGKDNIGFKKAQWRICTPAHPWNVAVLARINPATQDYDEESKRVVYKGLKKIKLEENESEKKLREREALKQSDIDKGIYKRPSEYITDKGVPAGHDSKGRALADYMGTRYVSVSPEVFNEELYKWRKDKSLPSPVSTSQKDHKKIFGE